MTALLIILVIVLVLVVLLQIALTSDFINFIKGDDDEEGRSKFQGSMLMVFLVIGFIALIWSIYYFKGRFLPESASEHGHLIDMNFNLALFFTGIVFVVTQILLFYFAYKYRYRKGRKAFYFPENNKLEVAWTIVPAIVLTFLIVKGLTSWYAITSDAPEDKIVFEATGKQFAWVLRYPGADGELGALAGRDKVSPTNEVGIDWNDPSSKDDFLANDIVLPVGKPVEVKIEAMDVIHSFFLPHFRVKMDAVPGITTRFWFVPTITTEEMREKLGDPGFNFELACAELCGRGHSSMRKVVTIVTPEEYQKWVEAQTPYSQLVGAYEQKTSRQTAENTNAGTALNAEFN